MIGNDQKKTSKIAEDAVSRLISDTTKLIDEWVISHPWKKMNIEVDHESGKIVVSEDGPMSSEERFKFVRELIILKETPDIKRLKKSWQIECYKRGELL